MTQRPHKSNHLTLVFNYLLEYRTYVRYYQNKKGVVFYVKQCII